MKGTTQAPNQGAFRGASGKTSEQCLGRERAWDVPAGRPRAAKRIEWAGSKRSQKLITQWVNWFGAGRSVPCRVIRPKRLMPKKGLELRDQTGLFHPLTFGGIA